MQNQTLPFKGFKHIKKNLSLAFSKTTKNTFEPIPLVRQQRNSSQLTNPQSSNNNKTTKIQMIDTRLKIHQNQLQKNNFIIKQLTNTIISIKQQLQKEKQKYYNSENINLQLKQQINKNNKLIKIKTLKINQLIRKYENINQELDHYKNIPDKNQQINKINQQLKKDIQQLQNTVSDKNDIICTLYRQIDQYKQKISILNLSQLDHQKTITQLKQKTIELEKSNNLFHLQQTQTQNQKSKNISHSLSLQQQIQSLSEQLIKKNNQSNQNKQYLTGLENDVLYLKQKISKKQNQISALNNELTDLKTKLQQIKESNKKKNFDDQTQIQKIISMQSTITQLQKIIETQQTQLQSTQSSSKNYQTLKSQSTNLKKLYHSIIPQIQCPLGHILSNPVTVIPCGHNYCFQCKKGYTNSCMLCKGKIKIQAIYRNQLMDDIIRIVNGTKCLLEIIK